MGFDEALADGQSQASAARLGRVERLERLLALFGGEARAVVAHGDAQGLAAVELGGRDANCHARRALTCRQGVVEQITELLPEVEGGAGALEVDAVDLLAQLAAGRGPTELDPGLAPDLGQVAC